MVNTKTHSGKFTDLNFSYRILWGSRQKKKIYYMGKGRRRNQASIDLSSALSAKL